MRRPFEMIRLGSQRAERPAATVGSGRLWRRLMRIEIHRPSPARTYVVEGELVSLQIDGGALLVWTSATDLPHSDCVAVFGPGQWLLAELVPAASEVSDDR